MKKILLIEDNFEFASLIKDFLDQRSLHVDICDDPFRAVVTSLADYNLVLLDLGLPGMDGLEVCTQIRKKNKIPIIISSARNSTSDKVMGLQLGADDYLPKPYDPDELYARIISLLRRANDFQKEEKEAHFVLDTKAQVLIKNYENVVSKEQLLYSSPAITSGDGKSLEMIISKIRHKIEPFSEKNHIVALRGRGYRLVE